MAEQTQASIEIDASLPATMAVIADLESYPEWINVLTSVEVNSVYEGDDLPAEATFTLDAGVIKDVYDLEYDWEGDQKVSWHLLRGGILSAMDGSYELQPTASGGTEVTYRLTVDVNLPMIGMVKRNAEKMIIDTALKGLKKRVEATGTA
jgi:ribosome-associated toxin RatA of RatAB toxin-antitoxin module